jgi:hypothetical protein
MGRADTLWAAIVAGRSVVTSRLMIFRLSRGLVRVVIMTRPWPDRPRSEEDEVSSGLGYNACTVDLYAI